MPAVIADSIHTLTLQPIAAADVDSRMMLHLHHEASSRRRQQFEKMLEDLWLCYRAAMARIKNIKVSVQTDFPAGTTIGEALFNLMELFRRNIVPVFGEAATFNIDAYGNNEQFFFTVYKTCNWDSRHMCFALKPILKSLRRGNHRALLTLFLDFLRAFEVQTKVGTWYDGTMEMAELWFEDQLQQRIDERPDPHDPEWDEYCREIDGMKKDLFSYRFGEAAKMADQLVRRRLLSTDVIRQRLARIRKDHPVKSIIDWGCEIIDRPLEIGHFNYWPEGDDEGYEGLPFAEQAVITWGYDGYSDCYSEFVDDRANNVGVMDPTMAFKIDALQKEWGNHKIFDSAGTWPRQLMHWFDHVNDSMEKHEQKNRIRIQ